MPIVDARETALNMIAASENYTPNQIIDLLKSADNEYANESESFIEDNEYDALRLIAQRLSPTDEYFLGVGSEVRGGKVKLPFQMGSLDQVEIGDIEEWVRKNNLQEEEIVATDKMDGTSALIVYNKGGFPQIAYSRGNGTEGADISRHIFKIKNVPEQLTSQQPMTIRAEVELTESAFLELREKIKSSSGKKYKNARNMVAGIMNSSERPDFVYDYLSVIAYQIIGVDTINKAQMLARLSDNGFQVTPRWRFLGKELNDKMLAEYLNKRRDDTDYAIDGLVLDVNSISKRQEMNPTRDTLNPAYSIKYKVADADNTAIATVKSVTWNVSKHGYLKPQVNLEPFELCGVTISNATGFNARFILDNAIGSGAKVRMTRSGDVIPFIQEVVLGAKNVTCGMPDNMDECEWNETGVDLVLKEGNDEVSIRQSIDFFEKIEAPLLKEGNVRKLFNAGYDTPAKIIHDASKQDLINILGENGKKVFAGLELKLNNIPVHKLMGAFSTERGMGVRKFKKLEKAIGQDALAAGSFSLWDVLSVDGFETKSAGKAIAVGREFVEFLTYIDGHYSFEEVKDTSGGSLEGQKICMTGFRDKDMSVAIEAAGGEIQSGVSGKTTLLVCKDPTSNSGKVKKAKDKGVKVISIDEMRDML